MEYVLILAILVAVAFFVSVPLRRPPRPEAGPDTELADLEARKEAKYREIRDTETDRAAGKLTEGEWKRQDTELRREAIAILKRIDELEKRARRGA